MLEVVIALSLAVLVGSAIAHKTRITPAIVLIFIGLAIGIMPAHELHEVQSIGLPPHVILEIFLPIMLFWEARHTSWREARNRIRGIILTGTLLVIVTAFGVAGILHELIGVSAWGAALLIGVALAPTDAVAVATLNGKLPKSSITNPQSGGAHQRRHDPRAADPRVAGSRRAGALPRPLQRHVLLLLPHRYFGRSGGRLGSQQDSCPHRQPDVVHLLHADRALHRVPARGED